MRMLGGRVLIRHTLKPALTSGGIFIPEQFRGQAQEGVVMSVSEGWWEPEVGWCKVKDFVEVGERVLFEKRAGQIVEVGGKKLRLIHVRDLLATLRVGKVKVCGECEGQGVVDDDDQDTVCDEPGQGGGDAGGDASAGADR